MRYEDLQDKFGTQTEIAKVFGVTQGAISNWRKFGIPIDRQWQAQLLTAGRLVADSMQYIGRHKEKPTRCD